MPDRSLNFCPQFTARLREASESEGAKFWLAVLNDINQRGVGDVLIACVDGLTGFPEAIEAVFPDNGNQHWPHLGNFKWPHLHGLIEGIPILDS